MSDEQSRDEDVHLRVREKTKIFLGVHAKRIRDVVPSKRFMGKEASGIRATTIAGFATEYLEGLWKQSPIYSLDSSSFLLVTADGDFVHYRREELENPNNASIKIPFRVQMKHSKIRDYVSQEKDAESNLRSKWLFHRFRLTDPRSGDGEIGTDVEGITSKGTNIPWEKGGKVIRETAVALSDYVQWRRPYEGASPMDSVDIDVKLPTLTERLMVVIDPRLYRDTPDGLRPAGARYLLGDGEERYDKLGISFELRNQENQPATSPRPKWTERVAKVYPFPKDPQIERRRKASESKRWTKLRDTALEEIRENHERLVDLMEGSNASVPALPDRFMFYWTYLAAPFPGARLAVTWPAPEKPAQFEKKSTSRKQKAKATRKGPKSRGRGRANP